MVVHLLNVLIISNAGVNDPITSANNPRIINNEFFTISLNFENPDLVLKKTRNSITAGSAIPRTDKHKAPTNDMNKSNLGIATANKTEKCKTKTNVNKLHSKNIFEFEHLTR